MSRHKSNPGPIPARWLHCPRKSNGLIANKFIAMKTPLDFKFNDQVPPECRFTPKMVFDICKLKRIKIGLWVDLTNTTRFYNQKEVEENDCKYVKLQCRGHGETPSKEQTTLFINCVDTFIRRSPLENIAVHCTHGFNRTGFLLISYMVEKMDFPLEVAMENFSCSRPVGIYKQDYINELYNRYDDVDEITPAPPLPDWCLETDNVPESLDDFDDIHNECSTSQLNNSNNKNTPSRRKNIPKFMEGVPGVEAFILQPKAGQLQKQVQRMCNWKSKGFPGSQPVSMTTNNVKLLNQKPYRVSWKADGTRYMMLIDCEREVYFFDRDHNVFLIEGLRFLQKDLKTHVHKTLLDGEMVLDKVNDQIIPRYLVYDIVTLQGDDVGSLPFYPNRLKLIDDEIINPRSFAIQRGYIDKTKEPFSVRKKEFWDITQAASLLGVKFAKNLSHEPDGLIFQPSEDPYKPGACENVLKWKPPHMNSVDFRLKIFKETGQGKLPKKVCSLYVGHRDEPVAIMKYTAAVKHLNNKIVECNFENGQWVFMRERTDKSFPNSASTAEAVFDSIMDPVTKDGLLNYIAKHAYKNDAKLMGPPKQARR